MLKWLVLAVVVIAAIWLLRRPAPTRREDARAGSAAGDALVACAHCSVLLPRAEALERDGQLYCCDEHRSRGRAG